MTPDAALERRAKALEQRAQDLETAAAWILVAIEETAGALRNREKDAQHYRYHVLREKRSDRDRAVILDYTEIRLKEIEADLRTRVDTLLEAIGRGVLRPERSRGEYTSQAGAYLVTTAGRVGRVLATRVDGGEMYHEVAYADGTIGTHGAAIGEVLAFGDASLIFEYVAMLIEQGRSDQGYARARDVARGMSELLKSPVPSPEGA